MIRRVAVALAAILTSPAAWAQAPADAAAAFGVRESVRSIALSPDGRTLAYVQPAAGALYHVLDPTLFRAAIAIAPVTDLELTRTENGASLAVFDFIGTGPHVREGSPSENAAAFRAPVLMFHGTLDANVGIRQARLMRDRLRDAGKPVELVEFEGPDHQLEDSAARTQCCAAAMPSCARRWGCADVEME